MSIVIDNNGIRLQDTEIILEEYRNIFKSVFGDTVDTSFQGVNGQLIDALVQKEVENSKEIIRLFNGFSIDNSNGVYLDYQSRLFGINRRKATNTLVKVKFIGLDGVKIPVGFRLQDSNKNIYVNRVEGIIASGQVILDYYCEIAGSIEITSNSIDFYDILPNIDRVVNEKDGITGQDIESDESLRSRIIQSRSINSVGLMESLYSAISQLTNNFSLTQNNTLTDIIQGSITIPPHCILLCINDGEPEEIAKILYEKNSAGVAMVGNEEYKLTTPYNSNFIAKFQRPTVIDILLNVELVQDLKQIADVENVIKDTLKKYFDSINIVGTTFFASDFICELSKIGVRSIKDITINSGKLTNFSLSAIQLGSLSKDDIYVIIK